MASDQHSTSVYTQGHSASSIASHEQRTVQNSAKFLLPHLKPDFSILDIGSGPGSITSGFLEYVPSGKVTGIDISDAVIEHASSKYPSSKYPNLKFEYGDVLDGLKYKDNSFDAIYTSQTMVHLPDPVKAMKEMRRVLKPGGFIALRETDIFCWYPELPGLTLFTEIMHQMVKSTGASGFYSGRKMHVWAREAGFERSKMILGGTATVFSSNEERKWFAGVHIDRFKHKEEGVGKKIRELGLLKESDISKVIGDIERWRDDQDGTNTAWQSELISFK